MNKRLLYVIGSLDIGGAEQHLLGLLPKLKDRGYEILIYTIGREGALAPEFKSKGINIRSPILANFLHSLPYKLGRPFLLLISIISLMLLMLSYRPMIIHFFLPEAYLVGGLVSCVIPGVHRIMSRRSLANYQSNHPFFSRVEYWLHTHMDVILGNSLAVNQQLVKEGVNNKNIRLIYNGIEGSNYDKPINRKQLRMELSLDKDTLVFVFVGNLIPYKGHEDLLKAFSLVSKELGNDWTLLCVGRDEGIGNNLKLLANELSIDKNIRWMGARRDIVDILKLSDVGVLCSHQEGFSNSVLEGMAASLPMIVTNVGGNAEAVIDGENGFVVPSKDPKALSNAIKNMAEDSSLRKVFGEAANARVRKYFNLSGCVEAYDSCYRELLEN